MLCKVLKRDLVLIRKVPVCTGKKVALVLKPFLLIPVLFSSFFVLPLTSCSSSPKRKMEVTDTYNKTVQVYQSANSSLNSGKMLEAGNSLRNSYDWAISIDAKDLLCRICLSCISFGFSAKRQLGDDYAKVFYQAGKSENVLNYDARTLLAMAEDYAAHSNNSEQLKAACAIYEALIVMSEIGNSAENVDGSRKGAESGSKASLKNASAGGNENELRKAALKLSGVERYLAREPYYDAYLQRVRGDLFVRAKDYNQAEKAYLKAIFIHTTNRYLDEVAVDWYSLSRCRSKNGDKKGALTAVENALKYDKDAENTYAIASDYFARAVILMKEPVTAAQKKDAKADAVWASKVYRTGGFLSQAEECLNYAAGIE